MRQASWMAVAVTAASVVAGTAHAAPEYITASPGALTATFGKSVAERVFSDELSDRRTALVKRSLPADRGCGKSPRFTLDRVDPYKIDPGDVMWIERYDVACKDGDLRRAILFIDDSGELKTVELLPGTTIADPNLQLDASNIVNSAAMMRLSKPCDDLAIVDTEVTEAPPEGGGPWKERWSVQGCNETQSVDVSFAPAADGGTNITVPPS